LVGSRATPVAKALAPDIAFAVHDLTHDVLRFGVVGAGVMYAMVRHGAAAQGVVARHRGSATPAVPTATLSMVRRLMPRLFGGAAAGAQALALRESASSSRPGSLELGVVLFLDLACGA